MGATLLTPAGAKDVAARMYLEQVVRDWSAQKTEIELARKSLVLDPDTAYDYDDAAGSCAYVIDLATDLIESIQTARRNIADLPKSAEVA